MGIEEYVAKVGAALYAICQRRCYMDYPVASLKVWLLPPAQLGQMHVFTDLDHKLLGYMTWAWFSEESEQRWIAGTLEAPHISEWNEGERLWIIDFVTLPGYTARCLHFAPAVFPEGAKAKSLLRRPSGGTRTVIEWAHWPQCKRGIRRVRSRGIR